MEILKKHFTKQRLCKQVTMYEIKNIGQFQHSVVSKHYIVKEEEMDREQKGIQNFSHKA